jgi:DNA-binding HxlR family transcriptional regulator
MTQSGWKVVMDRDVVTLSGNGFELTATGADPAHLDTVVSELAHLTRSTYGQYCGLARALEIVGERWGLLIVRDLLVGAKSAAELRRGLPRMPARTLSLRLKELTAGGVVQSAGSTDARGGERYELTGYGRALEEILLELGRWGAATLATPRPEDIVTEDSMTVALRATFVASAALDARLTFELRLGKVVVHGIVDDGRLDVNRGPLPGADVVIHPGGLLKALLTRELTAAEAMATGEVTVTGAPGAFERFVEMFELPTVPVADVARS